MKLSVWQISASLLGLIILQENFASASVETPTRLFGGIQLRKQYNSYIWLQPQQAQFDPSTRTSIIELIQRRSFSQPFSLGLDQNHLLLKAQAAKLDAQLRGDVERTRENPQDLQSHLSLALAKLQAQENALQPQAPALSSVEQVDKFFQQTIADLQNKTWCAGINLENNLHQQEMELDAKYDKMQAMQMDNCSRLDNLMANANYKAQLLHSKMQISLKQSEAFKNKAAAVQQASMSPLENDEQLANLNAQLIAKSCEAHLLTSDNATDTDNESVDAKIKWDKWYEGVSEAVKAPLIEAVNKHGNPAGINTMRITVWSDLRLRCELIQPGNRELDAAVAEAYDSLNFNAALEFPPGSRRKVVTFLSDQKHLEKGEVVYIDAKELTGDVEHGAASAQSIMR